MANNTYESSNISVQWFDIDLSTGWGEDTFLTIEPLGARVEAKFGAEGSVSPNKLANKGATISLTLAQTADANKKIADIWAAQEVIGAPINVSPFQVIDRTGDSAHFVALNAFLTEVPGHSFAATSGEKTWVWVCESYIETSDPSTVTSALRDYLTILD